jgi:peptidyl-tRNA hydrolase
MDPNSRLRHEHREAAVSKNSQDARTQAAALEFATPEELIRHDRGRTDVPPAVATRLAESVASDPPQADRPWWKRWMGLGGTR